MPITTFLKTLKQFKAHLMLSFLIGFSLIGMFSLAALAKNTYGWSGTEYSLIFFLSSLVAIVTSFLFTKIIAKPSWVMSMPFVSLLMGSFVGLLYCFESSFFLWIIWGILDGVLITVTFLVIEKDISRDAHEKMQARIFTIYSLVFALGAAVAPYVIQILGSYGYFSVIAAYILKTLVFPKKFVDKNDVSVFKISEFPSLIKATPFLWSLAFIGGLYGETLNAFLVPYGLASGYSNDQALTFISVFMAGVVCLQYFLSSWVDEGWRRGRLFCVVLLALVTLVLLGKVKGYYYSTVSLVFVLGGLSGMISVAALALVADSFEKEHRSAAVALSAIFFSMGNILGSPFLGVMLDKFGAQGVLMALGYVALFVILIGLYRHQKRMSRTLLRMFMRRIRNGINQKSTQELRRIQMKRRLNKR